MVWMILMIRLLVLTTIFALTVFALVASNKLEQSMPGYRPLWSAVIGLVFGSVLFVFIRRILSKRLPPRARDVFGLNTSLAGAGFAFIAINFSLALFSFTHKISFQGLDLNHAFTQLLLQISPAFIKEIGFRFGLVLFTSVYFGRTAALVAGTIPFGLLHLINFFSGDPIHWNYFFATAVTGAFLTLIFFRYGLLAAILCHYLWSVLVSVSSRAFSLQQLAFEIAPTTLAVLISLSLILWVRLRKLT